MGTNPPLLLPVLGLQIGYRLRCAIALSQKILNEGKPALENYLGFLKGGCSKPPIDLLLGAGVNMASTDPIESALKLFDSLLDEMDGLMSEEE